MDKNYYKLYYKIEREHWWFRARMAILESQAKMAVKHHNRPIHILNIGVATGATTSMLEKFGKVVSVEYDKDCCLFLKSEIGIDPINASMTELPFEDKSFDLVCAFDVIEHIEDDQLAIRETSRVMKDDAVFMFSVPAFPFLWGDHDLVNHHFRRYTRKELARKIRENGLKINYISYFNAFLFLPIAMVRILSNLFKSKKERKLQSDFEAYQGPGISNYLLHKIFLSERFLLQQKIKMPFGVSLLVTGAKK